MNNVYIDYILYNMNRQFCNHYGAYFMKLLLLLHKILVFPYLEMHKVTFYKCIK